jgi:hypothetical protein
MNKLSSLAVGNTQLQELISASSVGSVLSNVAQVKNTFKSVVAGQVTGITQKISLAQKFGTVDASQNIGKSVHGVGTPVQGAFMSKISSITTSVGSSLSGAVGKFFG